VNAGVVSRTVIASVLLALVVGAGFVILIRQIESLRKSGREVTESRNEFVSADALERLVIDLETGVRGFVITDQERFLEPWRKARSAIPEQTRRLAALVDNPEQARRVRDITRDINSYIDDYSVPLVAAVRRKRDAGLSVATTAEGKRRVDALRAEFARLRQTERARLTARQHRDDRDASQATTVAAVALGGSVVLILLFGGYLIRAIAVPLRGAATMAGRLAGGDLAVRLRETGVGEVGALQRAFNSMGGSLEASRDELQRLADEQAALRRVATLVARDVPSSELLRAVAGEVGTLLGADLAALIRYETADAVDATVVWAAEGDEPDVGGRWPMEREGPAAAISRTGRPARQDDWDAVPGAFAAIAREKLGIRSSVGSPIVVEGRVWGALFVHSKQREPLPADTDSRLESFTDLVATSLANAQSRAEVRRLADEQAALRRVATLVAQAVPTSQVFEAVTREVGLQCDADLARMERFEPDRTVTALAAWSRGGEAQLAIGTRFALEGASIAAQVHQTGRPARVDSFVGASGPIAREAQALGIRASVGCPIVVGGRTWGVIAASTRREAPFPPNTESRIADFTELVATAVSNAEAQAGLVASRARLLTAGDDARRRLVRDLHDGAQQPLVHTIVTLKLAMHAQENDDDEAKVLVGEALDRAEQANAELRELAHGILPGVLTRGGLAAGVDALVSRLRVPVHVDVPRDRFPPEIEASAYFVVAEALTNVAKHSGAQRADVRAWVEDSVLRVDVRDDGVGGARPDGSGLLGLDDRVAALGGHLRIESPPGRGTRIAATLPLSRSVPFSGAHSAALRPG
jgi:signal transduction histidine kinase